MDDWSLQPFVGVTFQATDQLQWDNPQLLEVGLRYQLGDGWQLMANADWEDWSQFSDNLLSVQGGVLNPEAALDREWKPIWKAGIAASRHLGNNIYSMGFSYDSSPVSDGKRTIDLPMDNQFKLSAAMGIQGTERPSYALGTSLMYAGEGKVDQTAQGVRFKGKFDTNLILFVGGTVRYVY